MLGIDLLKQRMNPGVSSATEATPLPSGFETMLRMMGLDPQAFKAQITSAVEAAKAFDERIVRLSQEQSLGFDRLSQEQSLCFDILNDKLNMLTAQQDEIIALLNDGSDAGSVKILGEEK
jgi:predicted solute-binding protein